MVSINEITAANIMTQRSSLKILQKGDPANKAIGILVSEGVRNLPVFDKGTYLGFFGHQQLIKLQNRNPEMTKVEHFLSRPPQIKEDSGLIDIVDLMFRSNEKILPVMRKEQLVGAVSERDVMNAFIGLAELKGIKMSEVMSSTPLCMKESNEIGTALALMRDWRISRLPVLDSNGKVVGVLESFDAIKRIVLKETPESRLNFYGYTSGPGVTEQIPIYKVQVRELMQNKPVLAKPSDLLEDKIAEAKKMDFSTIIVVNEKEEPIGIVAPRDIVEWASGIKAKEGVYMQISGFDPSLVGDFAEAQLHRMIEESVQKLASMVKLRRFNVHFKTYHETADRLRYSLRCRVSTDYGLFTAAEHGYDIISVANKLFERIEREVIEFERKHEDMRLKKERKTKISRKMK